MAVRSQCTTYLATQRWCKHGSCFLSNGRAFTMDDVRRNGKAKRIATVSQLPRFQRPLAVLAALAFFVDAYPLVFIEFAEAKLHVMQRKIPLFAPTAKIVLQEMIHFQTLLQKAIVCVDPTATKRLDSTMKSVESSAGAWPHGAENICVGKTFHYRSKLHILDYFLRHEPRTAT